jgi:hypothetical protein
MSSTRGEEEEVTDSKKKDKDFCFSTINLLTSSLNQSQYFSEEKDIIQILKIILKEKSQLKRSNATSEFKKYQYCPEISKGGQTIMVFLTPHFIPLKINH